MKPIQVEREIFRYEQGAFKHIEDSIVTEFPVTIKMNGQEFVTMVSTPEYIEDMVIGFLASEGIIRKYEDIDSVWVQEKEGFVHVTTTKVNPYYEQMQNKRYITSCCGMSRQGFVFANDALSAKNEGCPCTGCCR